MSTPYDETFLNLSEMLSSLYMVEFTKYGKNTFHMSKLLNLSEIYTFHSIYGRIYQIW